MDNQESKQERPQPVEIKATFAEITKVRYTISATGQSHAAVASNQSLRMMHGRIYSIPINSEIDSDVYAGIKVYSDLADKIDVRYVKDGFASVIPLQNNTTIKSDQQLCVVW